MKNYHISPLAMPALVLLLCSNVWAQSEPSPQIERAFRDGNALLKKEQYAPALAQFRLVLKAMPNDPSALWNAGHAAFFARDYAAASAFFARLEKQEPNNGHLLAKRMQTAQAMGDLKTRDAARARLFALHRSGKDSTGYAAKASFCRDQFTIGKDNVLAFEYFVLQPRSGKAETPYLGRRYEFFVVGPDDKPKMTIETGWSALDVLPDGIYAPSAEMKAYYYDAYYPTGPWARQSFGLAPEEPSYEAAKQQVIAIASGKATPVSGQRRAP